MTLAQRRNSERLAGHTAFRMDIIGKGEAHAVALQEVKAGTNGWFEKKVA